MKRLWITENALWITSGLQVDYKIDLVDYKQISNWPLKMIMDYRLRFDLQELI